jgi:hypothetical protein
VRFRRCFDTDVLILRAVGQVSENAITALSTGTRLLGYALSRLGFIGVLKEIMVCQLAWVVSAVAKVH